MNQQEFKTGIDRLKAQFYKADPKPETIALYWDKLRNWDAKRFMTAVNVIIDNSAGKSVFDWPPMGDFYKAAPNVKIEPAQPKPKRTDGELRQFDALLADFNKRNQQL